MIKGHSLVFTVYNKCTLQNLILLFFHSRKALQKALGQVPPFPHGERPIPMLFGALE